MFDTNKKNKSMYKPVTLRQQNELSVFKLLWQRVIHVSANTVPHDLYLSISCYLAGKVPRRQSSPTNQNFRTAYYVCKIPDNSTVWRQICYGRHFKN